MQRRRRNPTNRSVMIVTVAAGVALVVQACTDMRPLTQALLRLAVDALNRA